jgi:hypothetical protein
MNFIPQVMKTVSAVMKTISPTSTVDVGGMKVISGEMKVITGEMKSNTGEMEVITAVTVFNIGGMTFISYIFWSNYRTPVLYPEIIIYSYSILWKV